MNINDVIRTADERRERFLVAARGLTPHRTALIMTRWGTPGIDWTGRPRKRELADVYAVGIAYGTTVREEVIDRLRSEKRP